MAHTLYEQVYTMTNTSPGTAQYTELRNFFSEKFGWTADGTKVISNIDPTFGFNIDKKFNYDMTEIQDLYGNIIWNGSGTTGIYYHVSKNEKTIYLRIIVEKSSVRYISNIIIAYSSDNKATVYVKANAQTGTSTTETSSVYHTLNYNNALVNITNAGAVITNLDNSLYQTPNYRGHSMCAELYTVISVQAFADIANTYITFNGQVYRVVECTLAKTDPYYKPTFAFPVSD